MSGQIVGKAELLSWAKENSGVSSCSKYSDLCDGLVFLSLVRLLYPREVKITTIRLQRRGPRDAANNWAMFLRCLERHQIPTHMCDRQAISSGHTRHCFNTLVLLYFLVRLSRGETFTLDFAQPVDMKIAAFLQSPESLAAVRQPLDKDSFSDPLGEECSGCEATSFMNRCHLATHLVSPSTADRVRFLQLNTEAQHLCSTSSESVPTSRTAQLDCKGFSRTSFINEDAGCVFLGADRTAGGFSQRCSNPPSAALRREPVPQPRKTSEREVELDAPPLIAPASSLHLENQLLREELHHAKAMSQLLLAQQHGITTAEVSLVVSKWRGEVERMKLEHLHELTQLDTALATSDNSLSSTNELTRRRLLTLSHRAEAAEGTAGELRTLFADYQEEMTTLTEQLHNAFKSISEFVSIALQSTRPSPRGTHEVGIVSNVMAQLQGVPDVVRCSIEAQLKTLLLLLTSLRAKTAQVPPKDGALAVPPTTLPPQTPDVLPSNWPIALREDTVRRECVAMMQEVDTHNSPPLMGQLHRLFSIIGILQKDIATAAEVIAKTRMRCTEAEVAAVAAGVEKDTELHKMNHSYASQLAQQLATIEAESELAISQSRLRYSEGMAALQQSRLLYDRIVDIVCSSHAHDSSHTTTSVSDFLRSWQAKQVSYTSMEDALREQCEEIAQLRSTVRLLSDEKETTSAELLACQKECTRLTQRTVVLEAEAKESKCLLEEERTVMDSYAADLHAALLERMPPAALQRRCDTPPLAPKVEPRWPVRQGDTEQRFPCSTTPSMSEGNEENSPAQLSNAIDPRDRGNIGSVEPEAKAEQAKHYANGTPPKTVEVVSALLSADELERRKRQILERFAIH